MVGSTAKNPSLKTTALFAYAAGATGILANVLLLSFLPFARPRSARQTTWSARSGPRS